MLCIILGVSFSSCSEDESTANYPYNVRMTDAPGPYDAVYLDVIGFEVVGSNGKAVMLNVHAGIYNLLNFTNGKDTLIASGNLENPTVQQIRLVLGPNNSVIVDGVSYPLSTPSAEQSGLKLQVHQTLQADVAYNFQIDFDANASIVQEGNGNYKLKPVLRTIEMNAGTIQGRITPAGTKAVVTATAGMSYSSYVSASGEFKIMGLPAGSHTLTITPTLPLLPVIQTDVVVTTGASTNIGVVAF